MTISVIETAINMGRVFTHKKTQHRELHALLFSNSSLTAHISLNMEGIVRRGFWEDLKV